MSNCVFERYIVATATPAITDQLVNCYRNVFASQPWGEWLKCPTCDASFGIEEKPQLEAQSFLHCDKPLVDYWPKEQVRQDIAHEITPDASCWIARDGHRVVGFCWVYPLPLSVLEEKVGLTLDADLIGGRDQSVVYIDEIGVRAEYRGHKLAKQLNQLALKDMLDRGVTSVVARTRHIPDPSVTFLWYTKKLCYSVLAAYPESDGRVVLGRKIHAPHPAPTLF